MGSVYRFLGTGRDQPGGLQTAIGLKSIAPAAEERLCSAPDCSQNRGASQPAKGAQATSVQLSKHPARGVYPWSLPVPGLLQAVT